VPWLRLPQSDLKRHYFRSYRTLVFGQALHQHILQRRSASSYLAVDLDGKGFGGARSQKRRDARF